MAPFSDRDGKSKTASAVDAEHYPEQNEVENGGEVNSAEPDPVQKKTDEQRAEVNSHNTKKKDNDSGSVQP